MSYLIELQNELVYSQIPIQKKSSTEMNANVMYSKPKKSNEK